MGKQKPTLGKRVGPNLYIHVSSVGDASSTIQSKVYLASKWANLEPEKDFNVIKVNENGKDLTLLDYPGFFEVAFPVLRRYWSFDTERGSHRFRTYRESINPPVLHRKELLLPLEHPDRRRFEDLTKEAESVGLFDEPNRIGFVRDWEDLLKQRGFEVKGHELAPIGNDESFDSISDNDTTATSVQRHLTALYRTNLSAPIQTLARFGYLDGNRTIFDYGCGRGGDVEFLTNNGVTASGWDPYYAAQQKRHSADIVNLGFVINVIEDRKERDDALKGAFDLANEWLIVSTMLQHSNSGNGRPYADGILTSRNTFQKYYSQAELSQYILDVLGVEPVPVAPGIFYAFKDQNAEQRFSTQRVAKRRSPIQRYIGPLSAAEHAERHYERIQKKYEAHADLLESLWTKWIQLGREPQKWEIEFSEELRQRVGSYPSALTFILHQKEESGSQQLKAAAQVRIDDLSVYFAQLVFAQKRLPRPLEPSLKEDIKHFFGSQENAMAHGKELLLSLLDIEKINSACQTAAEQGLGWLFEGHALQLHTRLVAQLPPILRTYVHCATRLYGDVTSADLVKIHINSGKLTLMVYDDFEGKPLPKMLERIKINLVNQKLDFFDYGDIYAPPYLYQKSRYINECVEGFSEQQAFDEAIERLPFIDLEGYGMPPEKFHRAMQDHRYYIDGFHLKRSQTAPNLDAPCGQFFTFRDLIECGTTQRTQSIANKPKEPDTFNALIDLATNLLDPIIEYFGMIKLTYGFCSAELSKAIRSGIAPNLDQHASCEKNRAGKFICPRRGAAVDFIVEYEDMLEVSQWIAKNLPFDRIYVYGKDRPVHLSYSPQLAQQVTIMSRKGQNEKLVPKTLSRDNFLNLKELG